MPNHATPWWRRTAILSSLALVALFVVGASGVWIGRATADDRPRPVTADLPAVTSASLGTPHGPSRMDGALPVGFTHDKAGALTAAAVAGETLIDYVQGRRITPPATWIATYTTGELSATSLQRIYDWNPALYQTATDYRPTKLPPAAHMPAVTEVQPVGINLISFSTDAAHVQVWLNGIGWSRGSGYPNTVVNRAADVELVWSHGDWKITSYTAVHGLGWDGPSLDDAAGSGFAPWPGGQITVLNG